MTASSLSSANTRSGRIDLGIFQNMTGSSFGILQSEIENIVNNCQESFKVDAPNMKRGTILTLHYLARGINGKICL